VTIPLEAISREKRAMDLVVIEVVVVVVVMVVMVVVI